MNTTSLRLVKILLFLFFLNSLSLSLYFLSHSKSLHSKDTKHPRNDDDDNNNNNPDHQNSFTPFTNHENHLKHFRYSKPWPILPSYLPWPPSPNPPALRSCEAYFGHGFSRRVDLGGPQGPGSGWFRCWYSGTLRSSVCEGGALRMVPEKVKMSRGGEKLEDVIGRSEEEELPEFDDGAFQINGGDEERERRKVVSDEVLNEIVPRGEVWKHTMRGLIGSALVVPAREFECHEWIEEPTLLVTRFEYANLFHTVTDWYSAYVASRVTGLPNRPHLVFVDGHCMAPLEETWRALFSSLRYAKNFSGPVCFRHAVLSPLGYETALFKGLNEQVNCRGTSAPDLWQNPDDKKTARLSEFGEMIRAAFHFPVNRHRIERPGSGYNVLFVRREDYLAHPRHGGKIESRLSNEEEVFNTVKGWASNYKDCRINVVNGLFAHMSMKEQVRTIQDAHVIIGAHGAGLTHIVSALPKTVVLEIISSQFRRPHFELIAQWKGLEYQVINLAGSVANPQVVVKKLGGIMRSIGCL